MREKVVIGANTYVIRREFIGSKELHELITDILCRRIGMNSAALTCHDSIEYNKINGSVDMKEA